MINLDKQLINKNFSKQALEYEKYALVQKFSVNQLIKKLSENIDLINKIKPKWLRLSGFWFPRGGLPIDIFFQTSLPPKDIFINDTPSYNYKAR